MALSKHVLSGLFSAVLLLSGQAFASDMVMFTASWCAGCREVLPVAQQVASEKGFNLVTIDVDKPDAPKQCKAYGLDIPKKSLPQVFKVDGGNQTLIYDGSQHAWGQPAVIKNKLSQ